jgi:hypothetical protein
MFARRSGAAIMAALACAALTGRAEAQGVRNVLELFTSQGCSSCPPADRILGRLASDPETLALSFPVDYWDYIGWKDTLAAPGFTARQRAYAEADGTGEVYTPQIIVNGLTDVVGSDMAAIAQAERDTDRRGDVLSVPLSVAERGGKLEVAIGGAAAGASQREAGIYLVGFARSRTVSVQRGENAGATLTYANVVRTMVKLGEWNGAAMTLEADLAQARADGADAYAVILQAGGRARPTTILAAAQGP